MSFDLRQNGKNLSEIETQAFLLSAACGVSSQLPSCRTMTAGTHPAINPGKNGFFL
jgi:hypothetical protein